MARTWGNSWATSWGTSWGTAAAAASIALGGGGWVEPPGWRKRRKITKDDLVRRPISTKVIGEAPKLVEYPVTTLEIPSISKILESAVPFERPATFANVGRKKPSKLELAEAARNEEEELITLILLAD